MQLTDSYTRITGNSSLNEAGYRKHGDYDFWTVKANNDNKNVYQRKRSILVQMNEELTSK
ncbi:MAG: hypothetical protein WAM14_04795 [Candidatus Nitrosopolaris sp.]